MLHGNAPQSPITGVPGWETHKEQTLLSDLAKLVPENGIILEVGAEFGQSASVFCHSAHPSVKIVSIDIMNDSAWAKYMANLKAAGFSERTVCIPYASMQAVESVAENKLDLVFIDGDHSFQGALDDATYWAPKVKVNGILLFHDCANTENKNPHPSHFDVTKAVTTWYLKNNDAWLLRYAVDSILGFVRTK